MQTQIQIQTQIQTQTQRTIQKQIQIQIYEDHVLKNMDLRFRAVKKTFSQVLASCDKEEVELIDSKEVETACAIIEDDRQKETRCSKLLENV